MAHLIVFLERPSTPRVDVIATPSHSKNDDSLRNLPLFRLHLHLDTALLARNTAHVGGEKVGDLYCG